MAKTLITWLHQSVDGERAARALHEAHAAVSSFVEPSALPTFDGEGHELLLAFGHRNEFERNEALRPLTEGIAKLGIPYVALVHAESWEPAQRVADDTGAAVLTSTRELTFNDLKLAFREGDHGVDPTNPEGQQLWKEYRKNDRALGTP